MIPPQPSLTLHLTPSGHTGPRVPARQEKWVCGVRDRAQTCPYELSLIVWWQIETPEQEELNRRTTSPVRPCAGTREPALHSRMRGTSTPSPLPAGPTAPVSAIATGTLPIQKCLWDAQGRSSSLPVRASLPSVTGLREQQWVSPRVTHAFFSWTWPCAINSQVTADSSGGAKPGLTFGEFQTPGQTGGYQKVTRVLAR